MRYNADASNGPLPLRTNRTKPISLLEPSLLPNPKQLDPDNAATDAQRAIKNNAEYLEQLNQKYQDRSNARVSGRIPVLMLCGQGGAGKDFAAKYLCEVTPLTYSGSTSSLVAPLVASVQYGGDVKSAFEQRRHHREYWYEFCNEVRRSDPTLLAKMNLAEGDMVVGPRDDFEVYEIMNQGVADVSIWIENPRVAPDPTVKFGAQDCDLVLMNDGGRFELCRKLDKLLKVLKTAYLPHVKTD